jgi:L-fuconolactonase
MSRIDAHHHVWDLAVRPQTWIDGPALTPLLRTFTVEELTPQAQAAGVSASVVVQTVPVAAETGEFLALAAGPGPVAAVVGWVDLTATDVADRIAAARALPGGRYLRGVRHQVQDEPDPRWLCRDDVRRGVAAVGAAGLVYDLLVRQPQWEAATATVSALPDQPFVLDHAGKPPVASGQLEPWAGWVRELARHQNVTCKLSGLLTEADWRTWTPSRLAPYAQVVLEAFGPERVMIGSDWPVCTLAGDYAASMGGYDQALAGLAPTERAAVERDTAARVYRIGPSPEPALGA